MNRIKMIRTGLVFKLIVMLILLLAMSTHGIAASISGTLSYTGLQTGPVYVAAFNSPLNCSPPNPDPYSYAEVPGIGDYTLYSLPDGIYYMASVIMTCGTNCNIQPTDPWGIYGGCDTSIPVTISSGNSVSGVDITLVDGTETFPNPFYELYRSSAWSGNFIYTGYYAELAVADPQQNASSVVVTGPGINGSLSLAYDNKRQEWASWVTPDGNVYLGDPPIPLPLTYTFTITDASGTIEKTDTINGYVDVFASNLSPSNGETVIGPPVFSWTGVNGPYTYGVEVDDYSSGRIWEVHELTDTTVTYDGPSLTPGNTYHYNITVQDNEGNFSLVSEYFVYGGDGVTNPLVGKWGYQVLQHGSTDYIWRTESGVVTFNNDGTGTSTYTENEDGVIRSGTGTFTYSTSTNQDGSITLITVDEDGTDIIRLVLSDDGKMIILDGTSNTTEQIMVTSIRLDPDKVYTDSDLSGTYYGVDYEHNGSGVPYSYKVESAEITFDPSSGMCSLNYTANWDGTVVSGNNSCSYSVNPDGSFTIDGGNIEGYLSGDGRVGVLSNPTNTNNWAGGALMKKADRPYCTADLEGTWVLTDFGDDNSNSFYAHFGSMSCDSSGNCKWVVKNQWDGNITYESGTVSLSVASDGSFGTSLGGLAPSYAAAIGNNGNTMIVNESFDTINQQGLNHRGIGVGVKCSSCSIDTDEDGAPDTTDNCPAASNPAQTDTDGDGTGDACDATPLGICGGKAVTIRGTDGADNINGTAGTDVIAGLGGNDIIDGYDGNDIICGGMGNDTIYGGNGADRLLGEGGNDTLYGGSGKDKLYGGSGKDKLYGDGGNDTLNGDAGDDTINGDAGDDTLNGGTGTDTCNGGTHVNGDTAKNCEIVTGIP